jgi:hypothetical protein
MNEYKVGDKVQRLVVTNQQYDNNSLNTDFMAGVVIEIGTAMILVDWDNISNHFDDWMYPWQIESRDWETREEEKIRLHNPKTHVVTYVLIGHWHDVIEIEVERVGNEQSIYAPNRRKYTSARDVDRLLKVLNSENYKREVKRGMISDCLFVYCTRKGA